MNDSQIEKMLRRAPQPTPPPDLLGRLQEDIASPKLARVNRERSRFGQHPLRRWMPAFAFGLVLLSCLVIIGMQANVVSQIKQRNEELRAAMPNLEELRQQPVHPDVAEHPRPPHRQYPVGQRQDHMVAPIHAERQSRL